jgi:hypothetical protein
MSDRSNRDLGRKKAFKKEHGKFGCDCWLCQDGKTKKRTMLLKQDKKESQKTKKEEV